MKGLPPTMMATELEDSVDLTDAEVGNAIATSSEQHLARHLTEALTSGCSLGVREIRRRRPHLYLRCLMVCPGGPPKVLVYCVDWLQKAS